MPCLAIKRLLMPLAVALLLATTGVADDTPTTPPVFGVRQYMQSQELPAGPVTIEGVVTKVFSEEHLLALTDANDCKKKCNSSSCKRLSLPVRWTGSAPKENDLVRVIGETKEEDGNRFFVATSLTTITSPEQEAQ